jgi:Putative amidase domain
MPLFNHGAAAAYATRCALSPNPSYPPFPNDCTSFVSQCMLAGGWTMIGGSFMDRQDDGAWWWGKSLLSRASYTWGGAHNFSKFVPLSGRGNRCPRNDLAIGDVVQIAASGNVFHTMIVTSMSSSPSGSDPLMSYHTTNTLNKALSQIEPAYSSANGFAFLYWKISDLF